ncbi:MAG: Nudix family hydrolase [Sulfuricaulis sp.]
MSASTPTTVANPPLRVAVGILTEGDKVFITRRFPDSHQGGKWEFPGGKIELGEDTLTALKRELNEELGIHVQSAQPFLQVRHAYPEGQVALDVWRIMEYRGTPHGREGQEAQWISRVALSQFEFPEADWPILRKLWLPALYLLTDSRRFGMNEFLVPLERALQAGARLVQLREPHLLPREYQAYARQIAGLCHRYDAKLLLNAEPGWVKLCGADGVHLNSRRLMEWDKRPLEDGFWVAASCHNEQELSQARHLEADFVVLSPVAATASHPEAQPLGWGIFSQLCAGVGLPVYALGGMRPQDIVCARSAGAQGLAMVNGIWGANSIEQSVAKLASA